ncbi:MAG: cyclic nucleotide-binding domain-containing protein, partial [Desulfobacterales bacterium]
MEERIRFLKSAEIFSRFASDELLYLAQNCESGKYALGDTLVCAGDMGKGLYLVRSGRIRLFSEKGGKETSVGICEPGDSFGELSLMKEANSAYSARASDDSEVLFFPKDIIDRLMKGNAGVREHLTKYIVMKVCGNILIPMFHLRSGFSAEEISEIVR